LRPIIKKSDSGYILNIGSLFSQIALAENSVYAATKFALAGFTDGLRRELKPSGVDVGLILLGAMSTPFQNDREEGNVKVPDFAILDPKKVAIVLEKMIRKHKKKVVLPGWMMTLLKIKSRFG
jgi:short-subunit dehydrogenase